MGTKIVVDTQNLIKTSNEVFELADSYKSIAKDIFSEVNYMSSSWQGIDNQAFVNQIAGFTEDFSKLDKLLRQYGNMLKTVEKEYIKTVNDSYSISNSI